MRQHLAPKRQDPAHRRSRQLVARKLAGCFQHRQDEPLGAVAVGRKVAMLDVVEPALDLVGRRERRHKLRKAPECPVEEGLVVPERVVGIEADEIDRQARRSQAANASSGTE
jgi:hypothetical protein